MSVDVVPYRPEWPAMFRSIAGELSNVLRSVPVIAIEHVGSTSVPGLAAKPILDIDIVVARAHVRDAIAALEAAGYEHQGDLGATDREAFGAPDNDLPRHVYVCVEGTAHLRNHLAIRDALRANPDVRDRYGAAKVALANDPDMDVDHYQAGKTSLLLEILAGSDFTEEEKDEIHRLNSPRSATSSVRLIPGTEKKAST